MCSPELPPVLAKLYNKCLAESCFPSCRKSSSVLPNFKNEGEKSDPGKYRPISLLPIISKIFESFINDSWLNILRSPAFSLTSERIYNSLDADGETIPIELDISKAFDKGWHAGLLHKPKAYGVVSPILSILESFLQGRSLKVVLGCQSSPLYITNAGVPQGSVLGPTLFLVFINDLPDEVLSRIGINADDTTPYSSLGKFDFFWEGGWLVTFSTTKTKLLSFNRHRYPRLVPVEMNGIELPEETSFRLLGLVFIRSMDWKPYIQSIAKAASRKTYFWV